MKQKTASARTGKPGNAFPTVEIAKLIENLNHREFRRKTGVFFVEGVKLLTDALHFGFVPQSLVLCPDLMSAEAQSLSQKIKADRIYTLARRTYEKLTKEYTLKQGPDGIGVVFEQKWVTLADLSMEPLGMIAGLCSVQDRGNVGTILRTCDSLGCAAVVFMGSCSDPFGPHTVKASAGAVFSQKLVACDIEQLRDFASSHGVRIVGTSPAAQTPYHHTVYEGPVVVLVGNEGQGLSEQELAACDFTVSIPMFGYVDSLNAAVAASVVMFEVSRQWHG